MSQVYLSMNCGSGVRARRFSLKALSANHIGYRLLIRSPLSSSGSSGVEEYPTTPVYNSKLLAAVKGGVGEERYTRSQEMAGSCGVATPSAPAFDATRRDAGGSSCVGVAVVVARRRPRHCWFGHGARRSLVGP